MGKVSLLSSPLEARNVGMLNWHIGNESIFVGSILGMGGKIHVFDKLSQAKSHTDSVVLGL